MDIHRCHFVDFPPSAINALAFSSTTGAERQRQPLRLAIGRSNGNIELWDPKNGLWIHELTLYGGRERSIEGLAWIQDADEEDGEGFNLSGRLRLFSIGYSETVTEWSLLTGLPLQKSSGSHGEIWCIAAQPKSKSRSPKDSTLTGLGEDDRNQDLAIGCADGSIILLSTANSSLNFSKYIGRTSEKKARALSLAWQNRQTLIAGFADSTIRVYDVTRSKLLRSISVGAGPRGGPKETLIWAVDCLKEGTVVSADSSGEVCFWDGRNYSQLQRIKGHESDALCLATSEDGRTLFSGGMDRRTAIYKLMSAGQGPSRWAKTFHKRIHQHDVKAMAKFESKTTNILVTGGLDTAPALTPIREFDRENHRRLPHIPQRSPIISAGRYIVSWWANQVAVWWIKPRSSKQSENPEAEGTHRYQIVARLALKGEEHITDCAVSSNAQILAVSTVAEVKIFHLRRKVQAGQRLKIKKVEISPSVSNIGARSLRFSPDDRWLLVISPTSKIHVIELLSSENFGQPGTPGSQVAILRRLSRKSAQQNALNGPWGAYDRTINRTAFSDDGCRIAVSDLAGYVDIFEFGTGSASNGTVDDENEVFSDAESDASSSSSDDSRSSSAHQKNIPHWYRSRATKSLPKLPHHALILTFRPTAPATTNSGLLFCLTTTHEIFEFDLANGSMTPWSRRHPLAALPNVFRLQRDRAVGCFWDTTTDPSRQRIWIYSATWLCMFDLAQDLPPPELTDLEGDPSVDQNSQGPNGSGTAASRKRKRTALMNGESPTVAGSPSLVSARASQRGTTGAGSRSLATEIRGGVDAKSVRRWDAETETWIDEPSVEPSRGGSSSDEDMENEDLPDDALQLSILNDNDISGATIQRSYSGEQRGPPFYLTTRYRAILGAVPLVSGSTSSAKGNQKDKSRGKKEVPLEVAIVERPEWEMDLPARMEGKWEGDRFE